MNMRGGTGQVMSKRQRGKKTPYAIYRKDNSYLIYDLTKADYMALVSACKTREPVELSIGLIVTDDIRAVIEQKPAPPPDDKPANPPMTQDAIGWLREQGLVDTEMEEGEL